MPEIKSTKNYKQFKTLLGNRILYKEHLSYLIRKIEDRNLLHLNPIIVNEKFEVIDGQHRLAAAEKIGLSIFFIQEAGLGEEEIVILNTAAKRWGFGDFLHFYSEQGYEDYIILEKVVKKYGLSPNVTAAILSANYDDLKPPVTSVKAFKRGEFKVVDLKKSEEFITRLKETRPFTFGPLVWSDREYIKALWRCYYKHDISHEILMEKFKLGGGLISYRESVRDYMIQLTDIVNKGKTGPRFFKF